MIGDFVWSGLRKKIGDWRFEFFFFSPVVVVAVADGRGGCGWCCGFFLGVGYIILLLWLYYFIMMFILFYCVKS